MSFEHYRQQSIEKIQRFRRDLESDNAPWIVEANAPFELLPNDPNPQKGIILIHGLLDSPFMMRDLGKFYQAQGFLVRGILLAGHGTIPEALDNVEYSQWIDDVNKAVGSLKKVVPDIYICGFSTGALLAIQHALTHADIKGIVAISPAIQLQTKISFITKFIHGLKRITERDFWNINHSNYDPVKYHHFSMNSPSEVYKLTKLVTKITKKIILKTPAFIAVSSEDETISSSACLNFFNRQKNPLNRLFYFTNKKINLSDERITQQATSDPKKKILDYSHIALPIAPDNIHYGEHGNYQYPISYCQRDHSIVYRGALNRYNVKHYNLQRLSYNPQFDWMCEQIKKFLNTIY